MTEYSFLGEGPKAYRVAAGRRAATVAHLVRGLEASGCRIITPPNPGVAPFRIVFEAPDGERLGVVLYLFTISCVETKNRPKDECRFQVKYGKKDGLLHLLWQDPTGLYTTLFLGVDPASGCWVAADPVLHSPTRMFISVEFKQHDFEAAQERGWHVWERESTINSDVPTEILVGGRPEKLLELVRFERAAKGLDQGHRHLLATERLPEALGRAGSSELSEENAPALKSVRLHELAQEFEMEPEAILSLIQSAPRLKMAVRGWVAEDHLQRVLSQVPGVADCKRLAVEGGPDIQLRFRGSRPLTVECKNVLRKRSADGSPRMDFQRTRASQTDRCSRYYRPEEFDVVAACLHAVTERWEFRYRLPREMEAHKVCEGRLSNLVKVDGTWAEAARILESAVGAR